MPRYLTIFVLIALAIYGIIEAQPLIAGPSIVIVSPSDNMPFPNGIVSVSGKVERATELTVNGAPILHEENGVFSSVLTLPQGGSILTFAATDRFGRKVTVTRDVFVPFKL